MLDLTIWSSHLRSGKPYRSQLYINTGRQRTTMEVSYSCFGCDVIKTETHLQHECWSQRYFPCHIPHGQGSFVGFASIYDDTNSAILPVTSAGCHVKFVIVGVAEVSDRHAYILVTLIHDSPFRGRLPRCFPARQVTHIHVTNSVYQYQTLYGEAITELCR